MPDKILTLPKVAQLLKVAEETLYAMAQKGERPAFKVRGRGAFAARTSVLGSHGRRTATPAKGNRDD